MRSSSPGRGGPRRDKRRLARIRLLPLHTTRRAAFAASRNAGSFAALKRLPESAVRTRRPPTSPSWHELSRVGYGAVRQMNVYGPGGGDRLASPTCRHYGRSQVPSGCGGITGSPSGADGPLRRAPSRILSASMRNGDRARAAYYRITQADPTDFGDAGKWRR